MDAFFQLCRDSFRRLYGVQDECEPVSETLLPDLVLQTARHHRVLGLLYAGRPAGGTLDQGRSDRWQRIVFGQAYHSERCAHEAVRLLAQFPARTGGVTLIKGPALAVQAWPESGLRHYDDLDFRCDRKDFPRVLEGLLAAGYEPEIEEFRRRENLWHFGWGLTFHHPEGFMVELNHRFFPPHFPWPAHLRLGDPSLFQEVQLTERTVRAPSPALHLLLSCLHSVWHGWERLGWMVDIGGLLVRHPAALEEADALAGKDRFARRALHTGCQVADTLWGPDLVPFPLSKACEPAVALALNLLTLRSPGLSAGKRMICHRQLLGSGERFHYMSRRLLIPGDGDFQRIHLPGRLRALYWLLRPLRALVARGRARHLPVRRPGGREAPRTGPR